MRGIAEDAHLLPRKKQKGGNAAREQGSQNEWSKRLEELEMGMSGSLLMKGALNKKPFQDLPFPALFHLCKASLQRLYRKMCVLGPLHSSWHSTSSCHGPGFPRNLCPPLFREGDRGAFPASPQLTVPHLHSLPLLPMSLPAGKFL